MKRRLLHAVMIAASILSPATACRSQDAASKPACGDGCQNETAQVMRTYQVPSGQDKTVERLLRGNSYPIQVVSPAGTNAQFVSLRPQFTGDGYFVLSAPIGIHEGVRQLLEELKTHPAKSGPPSVDVTYWFVLGYPSKDAVIPDQVAELAPALKSMANLGAMRFELFEKIEVNALDGEEAHTVAEHAEVRQTASIDKDSVQLRIEVKAAGEAAAAFINTMVTTHPGQLTVLGQGGFRPRGTPSSAQSSTLFYMIRAKPTT